eukprot:m51a1_g11150 hypothetical protein (196) ;mRNA; f:245418-246205
MSKTDIIASPPTANRRNRPSIEDLVEELAMQRDLKRRLERINQEELRDLQVRLDAAQRERDSLARLLRTASSRSLRVDLAAPPTPRQQPLQLLHRRAESRGSAPTQTLLSAQAALRSGWRGSCGAAEEAGECARARTAAADCAAMNEALRKRVAELEAELRRERDAREVDAARATIAIDELHTQLRRERAANSQS